MNTFGKRLALLLIRDYLIKNSDEQHPVSSHELINMLESREITIQRRTIVDDIRLLREEYDMDIISTKLGYYVASRDFELEEIKMLVDMVESSNFITRKKTEQLVKKLEGQVSSHQAHEVSRKIYVRKKVKSTNESVYINIDKISRAISDDRKIDFQYFRYNRSKERELRHNGRIHTISPYALIWVDQNYYLLGYDSDNIEMRHYRVDRMTAISESEEVRNGRKLFERTDMSAYTAKTFHMFTGEEENVTLRCANYVIDSIIDRFGDDIMVIPDGDDFFSVSVRVIVSPQFFAWLSPFGTDIEIRHPLWVREQMHNHFRNITEMYEGE